MASLLEDLLPIFQSEDERQFYRELVESYRAAAREIVRPSWFLVEALLIRGLPGQMPPNFNEPAAAA